MRQKSRKIEEVAQALRMLKGRSKKRARRYHEKHKMEVQSRKEAIIESTVSKKKVLEFVDTVSEEGVLKEPENALLRRKIEERRKKKRKLRGAQSELL